MSTPFQQKAARKRLRRHLHVRLVVSLSVLVLSTYYCTLYLLQSRVIKVEMRIFMFSVNLEAHIYHELLNRHLSYPPHFALQLIERRSRSPRIHKFLIGRLCLRSRIHKFLIGRLCLRSQSTIKPPDNHGARTPSHYRQASRRLMLQRNHRQASMMLILNRRHPNPNQPSALARLSSRSVQVAARASEES